MDINQYVDRYGVPGALLLLLGFILWKKVIPWLVARDEMKDALVVQVLERAEERARRSEERNDHITAEFLAANQALRNGFERSIDAFEKTAETVVRIEAILRDMGRHNRDR